MNPRTDVERNWAMAAHLAGLCGYFVPFGHIGGPLVIWLIKKDQHPFVDDQGKEAVNFQISLTIYLLAASVSLCFGLGLVVLPLLAVAGLVLTVLGALKASNGETYRYPYILRLVK